MAGVRRKTAEWKDVVLNPRGVPVTHTDQHLTAISAELLTADFLRSSFILPRVNWTPVVDERIRSASDTLYQPSAVLLPLVKGEQTQKPLSYKRGLDISVLLTQRSLDLSKHAGQVALPGGKVEACDKTRVDTALRETYEEIGLRPESVEVLGTMPSYLTFSGFDITPVVGLVQELHELEPNLAEVSDVFAVPLSFLMDPRQHRWHIYRHEPEEGRTSTFKWLSMEYEQDGKSYFIWGVTAAILKNLYFFFTRIAASCHCIGFPERGRYFTLSFSL